MKTGVELIAEERQRQLTEKGWTAEHDDQHQPGELSSGGVAYAIAAYEARPWLFCYRHWPFYMEQFHPKKDPIANLAKAGAMIAAEIDRELRKQLAQEAKGEPGG